MKLVFVRHGTPDYEHDCLTEQGRLEAEALRRRCVGWDDFDLYMSPCGRAQQTAEVALPEKFAEAIVCPWLTEFQGSLIDGRCCWELKEDVYRSTNDLFDRERWAIASIFRQPATTNAWQAVCDGMDTLLKRYGYTAIENGYQADQESDKTVVLFCHMGVALACISYLLHIAPTILWNQMFISPASITVLCTERKDDGSVRWRALNINDTAHLRQADITPSSLGCASYFDPSL